ncbi:MAG: hypothetical protein IJ920_07680 [Paludibacteraceae bacterium]|jgi:hypothetical protein|nr:hypothetical protein [Paludibacteraceae bacterium]
MVAVYVNLYQSFSDRGAFVQKGAWQSSEIDESEIKVGEELPCWPSFDGPVVTGYRPGLLELDYHGEAMTIKSGEEVQLDSSLFSQEYGVSCYILKCVKVV